MNRTGVIILAVGAALVAIIGPVILSVNLAYRYALNSETKHTLAYARDVLSRSEMTAEQADMGIQKLKAQAGPPCAESGLQLMRDIDLASTYIQAIGYVSGNRIICSSLGKDVGSLNLGPADVVTVHGVAVRLNVKFKMTGETPFLVLERDGYAVIIHKALPLDVTTVEQGISLATFLLPNHVLTNSRGIVQKDWVSSLQGEREKVFVKDGYVVAVVASKKYSIGSLVALPVEHFEENASDMAKVLVPVGLLAGIVLAAIVFLLARQQMAMPALIKSALLRDEFFLLYQPVVELQTGRMVGAEALIRWQPRSGPLIRPDIFIPVAEEAGLIQQVTMRVLGIVEREATALFERFPGFHVAINFSADDFHSKDVLDALHQVVGSGAVRPSNLIVEVTERGFMQADIACEAVRRLRDSGFSVAIDDFGTGYSSLSYLQKLQIDYLKIDKSFVDTIGSDAVTSQVIFHIIELAKSLNLRMVAEGVETEAQAKVLRECGVHYAQGWLFGKPMRLSDIAATLARQSDR